MELTTPQVFNKRYGPVSPNAVYVGRPSIWGNPFYIGVDGTREEVIAKYRDYVLANFSMVGLADALAGKHLVCWCAPKPCHADVLLELANMEA